MNMKRYLITAKMNDGTQAEFCRSAFNVYQVVGEAAEEPGVLWVLKAYPCDS